MMIEENFKAAVFGATSLLGKSIIKLKPKKFVYISRKKINGKKIKWIKFSSNKKKIITKKKIQIGIFLISPRYIRKNHNKKTYKKEYSLLKKIFYLYKFKKFIYISSPTIYQKNHPIGSVKKKCEEFLIKNSKKFENLQIWRPYNLVGIDNKNLSDHFHNLLFKKIFVEKKMESIFFGCKDDERGYSDVDNFIRIVLSQSSKNISFVKNYGNKKGIKMIEIIKIFNDVFFKIRGNYFKAKFLKDKANKNIINKKNRNNIFSKDNNKILFRKYLRKMIKLHKIN